tara:strand:- start:80267 stop:81535 length:1269 start_codon:yes stop_codon:yes gene_type:complete
MNAALFIGSERPIGMPRILHGNFDFEHELARTGYNRPRLLERLNAELSTHLLAIAEDGDFLFSGDAGLTDFLTDSAAAGFSCVRSAESEKLPIHGAEFVPWGCSRPAILLAASKGWNFNGPSPESVAAVNSRAFSFELERRLDSAIPGAVEIDSVDTLQAAIRSAADVWNRSAEAFDWLVKAEFGMSGRERISGSGILPDDSQVHWIRRRLVSGERLYFEPRVESFGELSSQWIIPQAEFDDRSSAEPELIGTTQLLVDQSGQYLGSVLINTASTESPGPVSGDKGFSFSRHTLKRVLDDARSVAEESRQAGYHGPLGIDSMVYRGSNGESALRSIQDVNARFTMGRIALEWFRRFAATDRPAWLLVSEAWLSDRGIEASLDNPIARLTSPYVVAGQPVRRVGVLIDDPGDWRDLLATDLRP